MSGTIKYTVHWRRTGANTGQEICSFPAELFLMMAAQNQRPFVGPLDGIAGTFAAYGVRRLRAAYTGNLLRLRDTTNNNEQNFGYTSTGALDTAAITTFLGGHSAAVVTWYDQSGNGNDVTQATAGSQPGYSASAQNSKPGLTFDGTDDSLEKASLAWSASPMTAFAVGMGNAASSYRIFFSLNYDATTGFFMQMQTAGPSPPEFDGAGYNRGTSSFVVTALTGAENDSAWHQHDAQLAAGGGDWYVDGASQAGTATSASVPAITDKFAIGANMQGGASTFFFSGGISEIIIFAAAVSAGNRSTLRANQKAYWGTP